MASIAIPPVFVIFTMIPTAFSPIIFYFIPYSVFPPSALRNKVNWIEHFTETDVLGELERGTHKCVLWTNYPPGLPDGQGLVIALNYYESPTDSYLRRLFVSPHNDVIYQIVCSGGRWGKWVSLSTTTPPEEHDLPLAEGFANGGGGTSIYWKNQSNEVHVIISVLATASAYAPTAISTLPIGYRAERVYVFGCDIMTSAMRSGGMSFNVTPDGNIYYYGSPLVAGDLIWGYLCFVAS